MKQLSIISGLVLLLAVTGCSDKSEENGSVSNLSSNNSSGGDDSGNGGGPDGSRGNMDSGDPMPSSPFNDPSLWVSATHVFPMPLPSASPKRFGLWENGTGVAGDHDAYSHFQYELNPLEEHFITQEHFGCVPELSNVGVVSFDADITMPAGNTIRIGAEAIAGQCVNENGQMVMLECTILLCDGVIGNPDAEPPFVLLYEMWEGGCEVLKNRPQLLEDFKTAKSF